jgi:GTP-binding protein
MIDTVDIEVAAGRGGDGAVSFRREKFVPRGGPDGGDGGRGGDVIFVADRSYSTLRDYHDRRTREAEDGVPGGPNRRRGASGAPLRLRVPVGCVIWEVGADGEPLEEPLADLTHDGMAVVIARGGRGGMGNKRFATATRQAPHFAQRGMEGERKHLRLELKLLADVGLVGLPNAGKSTLLRAWSAATPKVADYPFTTLEPELGVVSVGFDTFVAADMPGLIEDASQGAGLGLEFLRHIERTRVLVHVLDMTREDPLADLALVNEELAAFGHGLAEKPQILALNKIDHPDARAQIELLEESGALKGRWLPISGLAREGVEELARLAYHVLRETIEAQERHEAVDGVPVLRPEPRRSRFEVHVDQDGVAVVSGRTPEWLASTLDIDDDDARYELLDRLRRLGVGRALARAGVEDGDTVRIGPVEVEWDS